MTKIVNWIKRNKLLTLIIIVFLLFIVEKFLPGYFLSIKPLQKTLQAPMNESGVGEDMVLTPSADRGGVGIVPIPEPDYAPTETEERLVVEESSMSMVVSDVRETSDKVIDHIKSVGGYMVNTSLVNPEEAPFATVTVRVPAENLRSALDYFRSLAVKVTSEKIKGTDVTDEYVDIEARLATLEKTKAKFEEIMDKATQV